MWWAGLKDGGRRVVRVHRLETGRDDEVGLVSEGVVPQKGTVQCGEGGQAMVFKSEDGWAIFISGERRRCQSRGGRSMP